MAPPGRCDGKDSARLSSTSIEPRRLSCPTVRTVRVNSLTGSAFFLDASKRAAVKEWLPLVCSFPKCSARLANWPRKTPAVPLGDISSRKTLPARATRLHKSLLLAIPDRFSDQAVEIRHRTWLIRTTENPTDLRRFGIPAEFATLGHAGVFTRPGQPIIERRWPRRVIFQVGAAFAYQALKELLAAVGTAFDIAAELVMLSGTGIAVGTIGKRRWKSFVPRHCVLPFRNRRLASLVATGKQARCRGLFGFTAAGDSWPCYSAFSQSAQAKDSGFARFDQK